MNGMLSFNISGELIAFNTNSGTSLMSSTRDIIEKKPPVREKVYHIFSRVDEIVGRLIELAGKDAMVWVASDHGFGPAHKYCSFNIWLFQEGFLQLKERCADPFEENDVFGSESHRKNAFKIDKKTAARKTSPCARRRAIRQGHFQSY